MDFWHLNHHFLLPAILFLFSLWYYFGFSFQIFLMYNRQITYELPSSLNLKYFIKVIARLSKSLILLIWPLVVKGKFKHVFE